MLAPTPVEDRVNSGAKPTKSVIGFIDPAPIISIAILIGLLAFWEASVRFGWVPPFILPSPIEVGQRVLADITSPSVGADVLYTLTEVVVGFAIALTCGTSLGATIAMVPIVDRTVTPYIVVLQTVPKVAIAPLLIIWLGFGIESKIVIVALIGFFPILVNSAAGFKATNPQQILLMKAIDAGAWQTFLRVRIPNAMPYIMAGVHVATIFSVIGAIVGEFIGSARGLGSQIIQRQAGMDVAGVFSILVILSSIGMVLNLTTKWISKRFVFWADAGKFSGV